MDWKKIYSDKRYQSSSGHPLIIGGKYKGVIGMVPFFFKACNFFDDVDNRLEESEEHWGPKNFEGISKSMEVDTIMNMVEDTFCNPCFIIHATVSDNEKNAICFQTSINRCPISSSKVIQRKN